MGICRNRRSQAERAHHPLYAPDAHLEYICYDIRILTRRYSQREKVHHPLPAQYTHSCMLYMKHIIGIQDIKVYIAKAQKT